MISPHPYREWWLIYGFSGSGKTHSILTVADLLRSSGSPARFHWIDTDFAIPIQIEKFPDLAEAGTLSIHNPYDFGQMCKSAKQIVSQADPDRGDWVIVDKCSDAWSRAPEYYCQSRFGKSCDEVEEAYKRATPHAVDSGILKYYANGINPMYVREFRDLLLYKTRCNVVFIADAKDVQFGGRSSRSPKDSIEIQRQFEEIGQKPACKRDTPGKFHTRIYLEQTYPQRWFATTARERGKRRWMDREEISNWAAQYLIGIAGWRHK